LDEKSGPNLAWVLFGLLLNYPLLQYRCAQLSQAPVTPLRCAHIRYAHIACSSLRSYLQRIAALYSHRIALSCSCCSLYAHYIATLCVRIYCSYSALRAALNTRCAPINCSLTAFAIGRYAPYLHSLCSLRIFTPFIFARSLFAALTYRYIALAPLHGARAEKRCISVAHTKRLSVAQ
jgi:hypothetical protein